MPSQRTSISKFAELSCAIPEWLSRKSEAETMIIQMVLMAVDKAAIGLMPFTF